MHTPSNYNDRPNETARNDESPPFSMRSLRHGVRGLAFWSAIALPFLYIPLLLSGLTTTSQMLAFVSLFVVNVFAVYVGQRYRR